MCTFRRYQLRDRVGSNAFSFSCGLWYSLPKLLNWGGGLIVTQHGGEVRLQQLVLCYVLRSLEAGFCIPPSLCIRELFSKAWWVFKSAQWPFKAKFWLLLSLIFREGGVITTCGPGKAGQRWIGGKEVEEGPGNDHTVVDVQETHYCHCGNPNTWYFRSSSMWFRRIYLWALGIVEPLTSSRLNQGTVRWPPREHLLWTII